MESKVLLTTAISYTNGSPHIGHLYESVLADFLKRVYEIKGSEVKLLTGTDEHGKKIQSSAQAQGLSPIELCNKYVEEFKQMDQQIQMSWDHWIRTTDPVHKELVSCAIEKASNSGDINKSIYKGWYCVKEESFITESNAALTNYCNPQTSQPYELVEEPSYMFKLKSKPNLLDQTQPSTLINGLVTQYDPNTIEDLSITRTSFSWGIPYPSDPSHVIYVWFDALLNYVTGEKILFDEEFGSKDLSRIHLIGKDIVWFHSIIYSGILHSISHPLPNRILVHGFVLDSSGKKMSKSIGNVIEPNELFAEYPVEAIRFYMINETVFGSDILFSKENLVSTYNNILLKNFGNLFQRLYNLFRPVQDELNQWIGMNTDLVAQFKNTALRKLNDLSLDFAEYRTNLFAELDYCNKELTEKKPWVCELNQSIPIYGLICIKFNIACGLLYPIIPEKVSSLIKLIGWNIPDIYLSNPCVKQIYFTSEEKKIIAFARIEK
jgi:methionyl-tRNA synthetase